MCSVLAICREHGQPPGWWEALPERDQTILLADFRRRDEAVAKENEALAKVLAGRRRG